MQYRKLGKYGIRVSEVSVGSWLTHGRTVGHDETQKIVRTAFDLGVNFFDTADVYHKGAAELALGYSIKGIPREELVIGTKCFFPFSDKPNGRGLGRKHIFESVHASLARMEIDYIDLMQFHRWDADTTLEETVRAIDDLIRQGKVLYWGVSEWAPHQIAEVVRVCDKLNAHPPVSNQPNYSMLNRWIDTSVIPVCDQFGIGQVVFSPLAQGVLTGKYLPGQPAPEGSRGADASSNMFMGGVLTDETLTRVQNLKAFANGLGHEVGAFALAWCLRKPGVSSVITGASSVAQVEANVLASGITYPDEVWAQAEAILYP